MRIKKTAPYAATWRMVKSLVIPMVEDDGEALLHYLVTHDFSTGIALVLSDGGICNLHGQESLCREGTNYKYAGHTELCSIRSGEGIPI